MTLLRALIIEDRVHMRLYMRAILRACGMDAISARDEACAFRRASHLGIDLILMDAETSRTNVLEFLDRITSGALGPKPPPVVVCSLRLHDVNFVSRLRGAGAAGLLAKPFRPGDLVQAIRKVFADLEAVL